jgi:hypothetical protein
MANDGLAGKNQDLVDNIMKVLSTDLGPEFCRISMDIPDVDGNISKVNSPLAGTSGTVSYQTLPNIKTKSPGISGSNVSGTEAMVAVIVEKTINHIMENFEVVWHDRIEALEDDFNTLATNLTAAAATLTASPVLPPGACAPAGAQLLKAAAQMKGPGRTAITTVQRALEEVSTLGTNIK